MSVGDSSLSPVCECEQGKKRSTTSILLCEILISFLRVGRFVDANEGKSECKLCEREGFASSLFFFFHIAESLSCEAPKRAFIQTGTELHGCSEREAETGC